MRINVMGYKGGVGKSVTAMHLAAALGHRFGEGTTVVVDADPNQSLVHWRAGRPEGMEPWPFEVVGLEMGSAWQRYENVVFDSQGRPSDMDLQAAVRGSDLIVVPTTAEGLSMRPLIGFLARLRKMGASYRVLLTMVGWWNTQAQERRKQLEDARQPVFGPEIRRRQAFDTATETGRLVYEFPNSRAQEAWRSYKRVADEAVEEIVGARRALAGRR
ncbi:MAG: ParA family protein [Rubrobacter sp.]|nr:ParA family protein [Rubrobacteraceae bacterium]MBA3792907.1 ParA family protein [Rubrobacter sp.]MDQ3636439.1 ParA family protein [Actinomycetota bacterium]